MSLRRAWPLLAVLLAVSAARLLMASAWAGSVPYWDQWDAEADRLLRPWVEGTLSLADLFRAHNEHRIVFSRLLTLGLFEANQGHWDNLVEVCANTLLAGAVAALAFALLRDGLATRGQRALLGTGIVALAVLPFGWENLLVGFQSQFHFMMLLALATLAAAARLRNRPAALWLPWTLSVLGLFTMASGLLAPVAAGAVLAVRALTAGLRPRIALAGIAGLAAIAVAGWLLVPEIAGHRPLRAPDLGALLAALGHVLAWPLGHGWLGALVLWAPAIWFVVRLARRRQADAHELFVGGLLAWVLLQALAMAVSRGNGLVAPSSRYTDVLAIGLAANGWLVLRAWADAGDASWRARAPALVLAAVPLAVAWGLALRLPDDLRQARERARIVAVHTGHVRAFVERGDDEALRAPFHHIPYPRADRLRALLSNPTIRGFLPWTVRPPVAWDDPRLHGEMQAARGSRPARYLSCARADCGSARGALASAGLPASGGGWWLVPVRSDGAPASARSRFHRGGAPLRFEDADAGTWVAIGAPVAAGPLSVLAAGLQSAVQAWAPPPDQLGRDRSEWRAEPAADAVATTSHALAAGERWQGTLAAPHGGVLLRLALPVAAAPAADARVVLTLCARECTRAEARLASRIDGELVFALERPLPVARGARLRWGLRLPDAGEPVAIALRPGTADPALVLGYLR